LGNALGTYDYTPYGQVFSASGTGDAFTFTGLQWDRETNSWHATARQLMGVEGRWLTPDQYGGSYDWTNPQSFNRDAYVNGMPMWATDPSGQSSSLFLRA